MKNSILLASIALLFSVTLQAQSTVDSIAAKYKLQPMPAPLTLERTFPAIGSYQLSGTTDTTTLVTINLDSVNRGTIWVQGLPQGTFKAYLKKSPATYRILAQKTASGKQIPEGTLVYDTTTNTLQVALGAPFLDADPGAIFAGQSTGTEEVEVKVKTKASKSKSKVKFYTASKVGVLPQTSTPETQQ